MEVSISICDPKELNLFALKQQEWNTPHPQSGGNPSNPENPSKNAGGTTKTFDGAGAINNVGGTGHGHGAGTMADQKGQRVGGVGSTNAVAGGEKPQEFKELRVGRCFTLKHQTHNNLLNMLKKTFPNEKKDTKAQNSGPQACSSSETELRDHGGELEWATSNSSRRTTQEE